MRFRTVNALFVSLATLSIACSGAHPHEDSEASSRTALERDRVHVGVMAPLVIGRLDAPDDPTREGEWSAFANDLAQAKLLGVESVSVDVWWGSVERAGDQQFDFRWVDRVAGAVVGAGLKWRPVIAFHSCGTNVGDTCHVPLPRWIFDRYLGSTTPTADVVGSAQDLKYVSSQGNASDEVLSVWATPLVLEQYRQFFEAFAARYGYLASQTSGIAIGLGAASELRYPSYNAHDVGAGYPGPGVLQAYSSLARASFRRWALAKHGDVAGVAAAWNRSIVTIDDVGPPEPWELSEFFESGEHINTERGRDFFDWYRASLLDHGRMVLGAAADVFQASPFRGIRLSARVPGIHWRAGDTRRAELSAGLIATRDAGDWPSDAGDHGYAPLVSMVADLRARPDAPNIALEYTCLEKGNREGGPDVASMAEALVFWVAAAAHRLQVPMGGENALAGGLWTTEGWDKIENALAWSHYDELTLLRLNDVVSSPVARSRVVRFTR